MKRSVSSSPLRKKLRLSSPTYDDHFDELDGLDFQALDEIETSFSRADVDTPLKSPTPLDRREKRRRAIENALKATKLDHHDDSGVGFEGPQDRSESPTPRSPSLLSCPSISRTSTLTSTPSLPLVADAAKDNFSHIVPNPSSTAFLPVSMLLSTEKLNCDLQSSQSLEQPSEQDHDAWFNPAETRSASTHTFTSVSSPGNLQLMTAGSAMDLEMPSIGAVPITNLLQRSKGTWAFPSADALDRAKKKHQIWEAEIETELETELSKHRQEIESGMPIDKQQQVINRKPLKGVENSVSSPPKPQILPMTSVSMTARDSLSTSVPIRPLKAPASSSSRSCSDISTSCHSYGVPLASVVSRSSAAADLACPGVPLAPSVRLPPTTPIRQQSLHAHPESQTPELPTLPKPVGPSQYQSTTPQKVRPLGLSPRARAFTSSRARPKFVTPFKQGRKPDDSNAQPSSQPKQTIQLRLEEKGKGREVVPLAVEETYIRSNSNVVKSAEHSSRITLANSKLVPRIYDCDELERLGFDANFFNLPTISHFLQYRFKSTGTGPLSALRSLGSDSALETLLAMGHHLATKAWVDNHWSLILWKIFGMACLEPAKVNDKWCWDEAMRQLRYRYERELASGSRPALRLIIAQDAPPSGPIVLCVSNIFWTAECVDAEGHVVPPHPELEVTDGWYRLRATVDDTLARAARNKRLRIGRKIACSGAKLDSSKKVPMEVLDAYGSVHLVLSGNSTHLAPWHAKLGFQSAPFIATLRSLTSDGGVVPLADLIVTRVYPVAYIEFLTTDQGETIREGPRTGKDEALEEDRWNARRSHEVAKLRDQLERKWQRLQTYADRLEQLARSEFKPTADDSPPDHVENLVEVLEDSEDPASIITQLTRVDAGWLSLLLRKKCETDREKSGDEIDRELASSFPQRQVRNFRVLKVRDARSIRKPSFRTAQLNVWDVMSLNITEGGSPGAFNVGQRYLVSSLVPSQQSAWMGLDPGSEIYLSTRRDSKWKLIK